MLQAPMFNGLLRDGSDALLAAQAFEHDPDFIFSREMSARGPANILYHRLCGLLGGLGSRFGAGRDWVSSSFLTSLRRDPIPPLAATPFLGHRC